MTPRTDTAGVDEQVFHFNKEIEATFSNLIAAVNARKSELIGTLNERASGNQERLSQEHQRLKHHLAESKKVKF